MLPTCVLTVFSATPSSNAIALFARPRAMQREHLELARGQQLVALGARAVAGELAQDPRGDGGVQQRLAAVDHPDRAHELGGLDVLEQVARGARAHGGQHLVLVEEARQDDDARRGRELAQALDRADAVEPRHDEVHEHDVGLERRDRRERRLAVGRLADDLDVVLQLEERAQALAHDGVVVDDEDGDHARHLEASRSCRRRARSRRAASPPIARARSSIVVSPRRRERTVARRRSRRRRRRR